MSDQEPQRYAKGRVVLIDGLEVWLPDHHRLAFPCHSRLSGRCRVSISFARGFSEQPVTDNKRVADSAGASLQAANQGLESRL